MRLSALSFLICLALPLPVLAADAATQWWADISDLANDSMQGRLTGSPGYMRAADYVISRFRQEGLAPAGSDGYRQPVPLEQQTVDQAASKASVGSTVLQPGQDMIISAGGGPRSASVNAPLVFIG